MSLCQGKLNEHLPCLSKVESPEKYKGIYTAYDSLPKNEFTSKENDVTTIKDDKTSALKYH